MSSALIRRLGIGRSRLRSRDFKNMSIFATIDKAIGETKSESQSQSQSQSFHLLPHLSNKESVTLRVRERSRDCYFGFEAKMASSSGSKSAVGPPKSLSRRVTMADPSADDNSAIDNELVPSSLAAIAPILRVANEVEKDNPRVAYICRFHAFEKAHKMNPTSVGRGVRQFKTYLLHRLEKEEEETKHKLTRNDPREIQKYYQNFYEKNIKDGQYTKTP